MRERRAWKVQINFAGNCAFKHITSYGIFSVIYPWNIGFQLIILIINLILIGQDNSKNSNTSNFPLFLQYLTFRAPLIEMIILSIFIHRIEFSEKRDAVTEKSLAENGRRYSIDRIALRLWVGLTARLTTLVFLWKCTFKSKSFFL